MRMGSPWVQDHLRHKSETHKTLTTWRFSKLRYNRAIRMKGLDKDTLWSHRRLWVAISAAIALALFLSTLQLGVNGSRHAYAADVGEIQNALPRWGTLHSRGYPQYSVLGSAFVSLLRLVGIQPALGASLFSALWGAISIPMLVAIALFLHVPPAAAAVSSVLTCGSR